MKNAMKKTAGFPSMLDSGIQGINFEVKNNDNYIQQQFNELDENANLDLDEKPNGLNEKSPKNT